MPLKVIDWILRAGANALVPIYSIPAGNVTLLIVEQPLNARSQITRTVSGNSISVIPSKITSPSSE